MSLAIVLDIILVGVIVLAAVVFMKKGFIAGIVSFIGTLASLVAAMIVSTRLAPILFEKLFQSSLVLKVTSMIEEQGTYYLEELVESVASFLPIEYVQSVLGEALKAINGQSATLALDIVKYAFEPLIVPIISVIIFFIIFAVLKIIIYQLSRMLTNINKIPLVGTLNQVLGLGSGVLCGLLQVTVILFAVWGVTVVTNNALPVVNSVDLQNSLFYSTFLKINPFFH